MSTFNATALMDELLPIVHRSGEIIKKAAAGTKKIMHKGRIDLVTETDMAVEAMLKEELANILPGSDFLAEETANDTRLGELTWIIDPVDGTTNFAHGLPFVATSIGLWREDHMELGVINLPLLDEIFTCETGKGAYLNGSPIAVTGECELVRSLLATGFPYDMKKHLDSVIKNMKTLLPLCQGIRRPGAAALDLAYVACGRYEGFYESALNPWDTAAGILLVEEAGGRVSQFDATEPYVFGSETILATNGRIHDELSALISQD